MAKKRKTEKDIISRIAIASESNGDWVRDNTKLQIFTTDGMVREFTDEQCCCERRYMTFNEDDLEYFVGATYLGYDVSAYEKADYEDETVESQFLNIRTNRGVFTVVTHNEHNGWYGGFCVRVTHKPVNVEGQKLLEKIEKKKK